MSAETSQTGAPDVGRMCQRQVITIDADADIAAAARLMREKHVGYLVVTEPATAGGMRKVLGVLTDRDIVVSVVALGVEPRSLKVDDVMTRNPLLVSESSSIDAALCFMRDVGVRRVPVVGNAGELTGVLALDDVLERMAQQLTSVAALIRSEQRMERVARP